MICGIIGVGEIAEAIVSGLCGAGPDRPHILLSPRNAERSARLAATFPCVRVAENNQAVLDGSMVVLLCVRPQEAASALSGLRFSGGHRIVSAIAGLPIAAVHQLVAPASDIARAVPLPAVSGRRGITPIHPPGEAARALFERLGTVVALDDERQFDAMAATTATIAAHFTHLGAISRWLADKDIGQPAAQHFVAAMFAGLMTSHAPGASFDALARAHATRGGLNEQFSRFMAAAGAFDAVQRGLDEIMDRLTGRRGR